MIDRNRQKRRDDAILPMNGAMKMENNKMTDRELLELAAKAYGFGRDSGGFIWTESEYPKGSNTNGALWNYKGCGNNAELWNPLADDGDALPLAVKLNMSIEIDAFNGDTLVIVNDAVGSPLFIINQKHLGNPCKATRRAIVLAAAEIGNRMA